MPTFTTFIQHISGNPSQITQERERNKEHENSKTRN
jgi:hypothetical protein